MRRMYLESLSSFSIADVLLQVGHNFWLVGQEAAGIKLTLEENLLSLCLTKRWMPEFNVLEP